MNQLQIAAQIRKELQEVTWPDVSTKVFGSEVRVSAGVPKASQIPPRFPWAVVILESATADAQEPELLEQAITIIVATNVPGGEYGQAALMGGAVASTTASGGRGLYEVQDRVHEALSSLERIGGGGFILSGSGAASTSVLGDGNHVAYNSISFTAKVASKRVYTAPQFFVRVGGDFVWDGTRCSSRYDFVQYRIVSKAGASPSDDPSDGTTVYTGSSPSSTLSLTAGTTYTVFADYNHRAPAGATSVEGSSSPLVGSYYVNP